MHRYVFIIILIVLFVSPSAVIGKPRKLPQGQAYEYNKTKSFHINRLKDKDESLLIAKLNGYLSNLPKPQDRDSWIEMVVIVDLLGDKPSVESKAILNKCIFIVKEAYEKSGLQFVRGKELYYSTVIGAAKTSLLKIEIADKNIKSNKEKLEYLIENMKDDKIEASAMLGILYELPKDIVINKMFELLGQTNKDMKLFALITISDIGDDKIQERLIKFAEDEYKKPDRGLFVRAFSTIAHTGSRKSYEYISGKIVSDDPYIREMSALALPTFYERDVITKDEVMGMLLKLMDDKDEKVSKRAKGGILRIKRIKREKEPLKERFPIIYK